MTALAPDAGPLLGQAATLLDNASRDVMRAGLLLDAAGLDLAPEFAEQVENLSMTAAVATDLADAYAACLANLATYGRRRRHG